MERRRADRKSAIAVKVFVSPFASKRSPEQASLPLTDLPDEAKQSSEGKPKVQILVSSGKRSSFHRKTETAKNSLKDLLLEENSLEEKPLDEKVTVSRFGWRWGKHSSKPERDFSEDNDLEAWDDVEPIADRPKIQVLTAPHLKRSSWVGELLAIAFWLMMAAIVGGTGWLAVKWIVDPHAVFWLAERIGKPLPPVLRSEQTMAEWRSQLSAGGLASGEPLLLGKTGDVLLPILQPTAACPQDELAVLSCGDVREMQIYRPAKAQRQRETEYYLAHRVPARGVREFVVLHSLHQAIAQSGSTRLLPFSRITAIDGDAPDKGIWLQLSGEWARGNVRVLYGLIMTYDPAQFRLAPQLEWVSPAGRSPYWRDVTAAGEPELIVDQTVGLEPEFQVYRVGQQNSATHPIQLEAIALDQSHSSLPAYRNGLKLAQSGLWSPALRQLQTLQRDRPRNWSAEMQAQLDVIGLHAAVSERNAKRQWASPSQQMTALLIDGRWQEATQLLTSTLHDGFDLTTLLRDQSNYLWKRITAIQSVYDGQASAQTWGTLILATRYGRETAIAWLQQQLSKSDASAHSPMVKNTLSLLNRLQSRPGPSHNPQVIGLATLKQQVNLNDWLPLQTPLPAPKSDRRWYIIEVYQFYDGREWQRSPVPQVQPSNLDLAYTVGQLTGLSYEPTIQVWQWTAEGQSQAMNLTVKAIALRNGKLQLLAEGEPPAEGSSQPSSQPSSETLLATAATPLNWLPLTGTMSLTDLAQQYPALIPLLKEILGTSPFDESNAGNGDAIANSLSNITAQPLQLAENQFAENQPPAFLISQQLPNEPNSKRWIVSSTGEILFSDRTHPQQTLVAIGTLPETATLVFVFRSGEGFQVKEWGVGSGE